MGFRHYTSVSTVHQMAATIFSVSTGNVFSCAGSSPVSEIVRLYGDGEMHRFTAGGAEGRSITLDSVGNAAALAAGGRYLHLTASINVLSPGGQVLPWRQDTSVAMILNHLGRGTVRKLLNGKLSDPLTGDLRIARDGGWYLHTPSERIAGSGVTISVNRY